MPRFFASSPGGGLAGPRPEREPEILQQTPIVQAIKKQIAKLLNMVAEAKKEDDLTYDLFWTEFGHILKEGIAEDATKNKDLIVELLRFETTESEGASISLAEIKEGMVEGQDALWYYSVDKKRIQSTPVLEGFAKREWEVIPMTNPSTSGSPCRSMSSTEHR